VNGGATSYRRHLPHYQPEGETYHVVFRLAGSIPATVLKELRFQREEEEKRIAGMVSGSKKAAFLRDCRWKFFEQVDKLLNRNNRGPFWLNKPAIAELVQAAIHFYDGRKIDLIADSIMPNHVHMVFQLLDQTSAVAGLRRDGVPSYKASVRRVSDPTKAGRDRVPSYTVTDIIGSIKKFSALRANRILGRRGAFWHNESYDRVIRNAEELERTIQYALMNPVRAGLCKDWRYWKWSYVKAEYLSD